MNLNVSTKKIEEVLTRGVEAAYPSRKLLKERMISGKKIKLYCGYDPSGTSLHIGHMITLMKLAQFQKLGHEVIMLIGDFTGMIGDPTDKTAARKKLTRGEVLKNAKNYKKQAGKILKFTGDNAAKILYNSKWSDKLCFVDLIELASNFTVQQMIIRNMFQERIKNGKPIYVHEFLYPLAQAYDSLAMDVDLEVGGRDQIFNMLCGRHLMKAVKDKEKMVLATKLLIDSSGKKMGKTENNIVDIGAAPEEMFGQIMAWPDSVIVLGLELCTELPMSGIKETSKQLKNGEKKPREVKARLAKEIVAVCHNKKMAEMAEKEFNKVFKEKGLPSRIPGVKIREKELNILDLLVKTKLAPSKSVAKRLVLQGGIKIADIVKKDWKETVKIKKGLVVQAGKRKFVRLA